MLHTRANRLRHRIGAIERSVVYTLAAIVVLVGGLTIWRLASAPQTIVKEETPKSPVSQAESIPPEKLPKDWVKMGGVARVFGDN